MKNNNTTKRIRFIRIENPTEKSEHRNTRYSIAFPSHPRIIMRGDLFSKSDVLAVYNTFKKDGYQAATKKRLSIIFDRHLKKFAHGLSKDISRIDVPESVKTKLSKLVKTKI